MPFVARSKDVKAKFRRGAVDPVRTVTLTCGHTTGERPALSSPPRWWCCNQWRRRKKTASNG